MKIECPYSECRQRISIGEEHFGKEAQCPSCGQVFLCPEPDPYEQEVPPIRESASPNQTETLAHPERKRPESGQPHKKGFCDECGGKLSFFRRMATEAVVGPQTTEALCGPCAERRRAVNDRAERTFSRFLLSHVEDSVFAPYFQSDKSYLGNRWLLCFSEVTERMSAFRLGELEVFDAMRQSQVRHGLELNWEDKVRSVKSRQFGAVGGVLGGAIGGAIAAEASAFLGGSKENYPEEVIPLIRNLPPVDSMQLIFDVTRNLSRADRPLSEVVCTFSGSHVGLSVEGGVAYFVIDPKDESVVPEEVRRHRRR